MMSTQNVVGRLSEILGEGKREVFKLSQEQEKHCLSIFKQHDRLQMDLLDRGGFRDAFQELLGARPDDEEQALYYGSTAKTVFDTCSADQNYLTLKDFQQIYCLLKRDELSKATEVRTEVRARLNAKRDEPKRK
ncbi:unnamed protein product [Amoebophrya sp. A25]|nr:unnamed protein product [Amoebophrya sp. A25]|eukprot:GSA25T00020987001.1